MADIALDVLYELYKKENNFLVRENMLVSYVASCIPNTGVLKEAKDFIQANMNNFSNYFKSSKIAHEENENLKNLATVFKRLAYAVDNYVADLREETIDKLKAEDADCEKYIDDLYAGSEQVEAVHLFKYSPERIRAAYKAYYNDISEVSPESVAQVTKLIEYVKTNNTLTAVFGTNNPQNVSIEEVLYSLYDYLNAEHEKFTVADDDLYDEFYEDVLSDYFTNLRNGTAKGGIDFAKYRPSLISKRAFIHNIDKLIFCRNILSYSESGIMPSPKGYIDFFVDEEEGEDLSDKLKLIYSKGFTNEEFRQLQSSPIFNFENTLRRPYYVEDVKAVRQGNKVSIGFLLSSEPSSVNEFIRQFYLMHIHVKDVLAENQNYEIQLNIIPEAKFDARIQLLRLDNYAEMGTHKNLACKLDTMTHVHVYNHLDILRGKKNGEYDIAYNFEDESTNFDTALETFLMMIGANENLASIIERKTTKILKESAKRAAAENERI